MGAGVLALETWFTRRSVLGLSAAIRPAGEEWLQTVGTLTIDRTSEVSFRVTTEPLEAIHFQVMTSNVSVIQPIPSLLPCLVDVNWQLMKKQKCQQKSMLMIDANWQDYLIDTVGLMDELIVVPTKEATVLALETWFTRRSVLGLSAATGLAGEQWSQTVGTQ